MSFLEGKHHCWVIDWSDITEGFRAVNLIERLMKELGVTRQQAEGGAGLLLEFAQQRLGSEEFVAVADSIPAISDIIGKAPRGEIAAPRAVRAFLSRLFGGLGCLYVLTEAFVRLGLEELQVGEFVEVVLRHFREKGGAEVEELLGGAFRQGRR